MTVDVGVFGKQRSSIGNYVQAAPASRVPVPEHQRRPTFAHVNIIVANNWVEGNTNASTAGITVGGTAGSGIALQMLVTGNWFGNLGIGLTCLDGINVVTGKWVIIKNNVFFNQPH